MFVCVIVKDKSVSLHCPWPESWQHQAKSQVLRLDSVLLLVTLWIQFVIYCMLKKSGPAWRYFKEFIWVLVQQELCIVILNMFHKHWLFLQLHILLCIINHFQDINTQFTKKKLLAFVFCVFLKVEMNGLKVISDIKLESIKSLHTHIHTLSIFVSHTSQLDTKTLLLSHCLLERVILDWSMSVLRRECTVIVAVWLLSGCTKS